ncbi:CotH kinase family protein [Bacillus sp. Bva_UNVM-123]|uniref:CotH kinase family protein n=1 Tax=Bacillus sp. Bva_UNVM-123 TaxID=2829798 RepID=UPI00391FAD3F
MIKNRYIIGVLSLLLVLFSISLVVLPRIGIESIKVKHSYVERVFNQNKVTKVDIKVDDNDLRSVLENPEAEKYVEATVEIDGTKVENVGLRTKGNLSLRSVVNIEDSERYSFKIDFDHYNSDQSLYGLKKLNLNNNYSDSTQMREYLSYKLMEKMGLPTPANSYMYVTINGKEWGLYLGIEQVDETFISRNFDNSIGDLYKPDGVGSDLQWISDQIKDYPGLNLKTNNGTSDQTAMIEMLAAINKGENIEQHIDVDEMLRYFAANTALVNLDSYQGQMKHNYYLYEQNGIFSIIPWDYNMSFGGFGVGGFGGGRGEANNEPVFNKEEKAAKGEEKRIIGPVGGELINEKNINLSITTPVTGTTMEARPLLNALLSVKEYREKYEEYLEEIATTFLTKDHIESITTHVSKLVLPYVEKDPTKFYSTEEFLAGVTGEKSLPEFSIRRAESIIKQLSGELVVEAEMEGQPERLPPNMDGNEKGENWQPPQKGEWKGQAERGAPNFNNDKVSREFGMPGQQGSNQQSPISGEISTRNMIVSAGVFILLIAAIIFAFLFKRRR